MVYSFHDYTPFVVSHATADWVGDSPVPADYTYPGDVLESLEWANWSQDAPEFTGQTAEWQQWDSGTLTVPADVEFATLKPAIWGNTGSVWFDDLQMWHNNQPQTVWNGDIETASNSDETQPANWFFWSDTGVTGEWSTQNAHSGTRSLSLISTGEGFGIWTQSNWIFTTPLIRVQPGDTLQARGWILAPENNGGGINIGFDYLNGVYTYYDRARLQADMQPFIDWGIENNVLLFVGEFGAMSAAPGDSRPNLVRDKISVMNAANLHWALWTYRDLSPLSFGLYHNTELDETLAIVLRQALIPPSAILYLPLMVMQ